MYSTSDGQKLRHLPDLDEHRLAPPEPLNKRKETKKRQREHNHGVSSSQTDSETNHNYYISTMINSTENASFFNLMTMERETNLTATGICPSRKGGRGKKPHHELLSDAQKKANHIAFEQKRRANIRIGYDQLTDIVPTLSHCHKSESLILQKSYDYIQQLLDDKTSLKDRIRELQMVLGDTPDEDSSEDDDEFVM